MPWARLDDRYHDHKKVKRALRREPVAVALHVMAITYCNLHNNDGEIERDQVDLWLSMTPLPPKRQRAILSTLLDLKLLECGPDDETYIVHDYLDWNRSRAEREALAEQGRRGGLAKAKANGKPGPKPSPSRGSSDGYSDGQSGGFSEGSSTPRHATPTPSQEPATQAARKRATRHIDQTQPPDDFPPDLLPAVDLVLAILHRIWEARGGIEPMVRGTALGIRRNLRADHARVALKLEQWLTAGNGRRAQCKDVCARFGDWVEDEGAALKVIDGGGDPKGERQARRLAALDRMTNEGGVT